ncbi:MAG: hypothetical protein N2258_08405 [Brevinematales bacterium]|nr:hypothetical protein [Brevinematales bacterium]
MKIKYNFFKFSALNLSFFGLLVLIFILIFSVNSGRRALEDRSSLNQVKSFQIVGQWIGTNGEYVEDFMFDKKYLYAVFGEKGLGVFNKDENLGLITNIVFETNEIKFSFKSIDISEINNKTYLVMSFFSLEKKGIVVVGIENTNIFITNYFFVDFLSPKSFCAVKDKVYVLTKNELKEFDIFDSSIQKSFDVKISINSRLKFYNGYFYLPSFNEGLLIGKIDKDSFRFITKIKSQINNVVDCFVIDKKLIIADKMLGISFYNINITGVEPIFRYDTAGDANSVLMRGNDIFVADGINGVLNFSYKNKKLKLEKYHKGDYVASSLIYDNSSKLLYVLAGANGIVVLK